MILHIHIVPESQKRLWQSKYILCSLSSCLKRSADNRARKGNEEETIWYFYKETLH